MLACIGGNIEILQLTLAAGVDVHYVDRDLFTALHLAVETGHFEMLTPLINAGAKVSARDIYGRPTLHLAVRQENTYAMIVLLHAGADVHYVDRQQESAQHVAAANGTPEALCVLLSAGCRGDRSTLNKAAYRGNMEIICALMSHGKPIDSTALHFVIARGQKEVVLRWLTSHRKDDSMVTADGTPLIHAAAWHDKCIELLSLLINTGDAVDAVDKNNNTALHCAAEHGAVNNIRLLLSAGANLFHRNHNDDNVLHFVSKHLFFRMIALDVLLAAGADTMINDVNRAGNTPLHCAAASRSMRIITVLLQHGAKVGIVNAEGKTAADICVANARHERRELREEEHHLFRCTRQVSNMNLSVTA